MTDSEKVLNKLGWKLSDYDYLTSSLQKVTYYVERWIFTNPLDLPDIIKIVRISYEINSSGRIRFKMDDLYSTQNYMSGEEFIAFADRYKEIKEDKEINEKLKDALLKK